MRVYCTVPLRTIQIGGDQHSGWLPANSSTPLETACREVQMRFEITDDGGGNFLLMSESADKSIFSDTWHSTLEEAKAVASEEFEIPLEAWEPQSRLI